MLISHTFWMVLYFILKKEMVLYFSQILLSNISHFLEYIWNRIEKKYKKKNWIYPFSIIVENKYEYIYIDSKTKGMSFFFWISRHPCWELIFNNQLRINPKVSFHPLFFGLVTAYVRPCIYIWHCSMEYADIICITRLSLAL